MTVTEAIDLFLADLASEGRSEHTVAAYRRDLGAFSRVAGKQRLDAITPEDLTRFMASGSVQLRPCGTKRAKATINRYRVSLKALYAWGEARWLVTRNPTAILKCRRHRAMPPEILTENEIQSLLGFEFVGKWAERDRALLGFMLGTGCRLTETVQLDCRDIDLDPGTIVLRQPKGGEPELLITSEWVCGLLARLVGGTDAGQPVFRTGRGRRLSTRQVQRLVGARCREAGITKPVTPHTLRHTFATRLYNRTGDIRLVQKALRHEHVTTTEVYAQVDPERLKLAVSGLS